MAWWQNHPNTYSYKGFIDIPEGDHRVRISNVEVERFSKGKKCIEVSFEVSGYHGMLWHHLWYDPNNLDDYERAFVPFRARYLLSRPHGRHTYLLQARKRGIAVLYTNVFHTTRRKRE